MAIRLAILVNGAEKAGMDIPARKAKAWIGQMVRRGLIAAEATLPEQAEALVAEIVRRCYFGAQTEFGAEPFDEMLRAVAEAHPEDGWDQEKVKQEGLKALEVLYDQLP